MNLRRRRLATISGYARPAAASCSVSPKRRPGITNRRRPSRMAIEVPQTPDLLAKFGPLRAYQSGQRLDTTADVERLVKTHCCFCGQQCGIQLKVHGKQVVGFEPWIDF